MRIIAYKDSVVLEADDHQDSVYLRQILKIDVSGIGQVLVQDIGQYHTYGSFSIKGMDTDKVILKQKTAMCELERQLSEHASQSLGYMQLEKDMRKLRASFWLRLWFVFCPGD